MKVDFPKDSYLKNIEVNSNSLDISFAKKKKIALMFICLNDRYWPYICQVIKDCRKNFLLQHHVDYFVWTDFSKEKAKSQLDFVDSFAHEWDGNIEALNAFMGTFAATVRLYTIFYLPEVQKILNELAKNGIVFKMEASKFWLESSVPISKDNIRFITDATKALLGVLHHDLETTLTGVTISETDAIEWPAPTLMRYHLFLNKKDELEKYDHLFYMDADMRVVSRISDEILSEDLTVALHPMYDLNPTFIPPYEPNEDSEAFIPRLGHIIDETEWSKGVIRSGTPQEILGWGGKPRFRPLYLAGGFQGGTSKSFIKAMETMKKQIDTDFDHNYTAIWNDESHWNEYVFKHKGPILGNECVVLGAEYVHPDSLIKEYYEPRWGRKLEPKIITLTKPFSLTSQGGDDLKKLTQPV